jgi:hypothetical protein
MASANVTPQAGAAFGAPQTAGASYIAPQTHDVALAGNMEYQRKWYDKGMKHAKKKSIEQAAEQKARAAAKKQRLKEAKEQRRADWDARRAKAEAEAREHDLEQRMAQLQVQAGHFGLTINGNFYNSNVVNQPPTWDPMQVPQLGPGPVQQHPAQQHSAQQHPDQQYLAQQPEIWQATQQPVFVQAAHGAPAHPPGFVHPSFGPASWASAQQTQAAPHLQAGPYQQPQMAPAFPGAYAPQTQAAPPVLAGPYQQPQPAPSCSWARVPQGQVAPQVPHAQAPPTPASPAPAQPPAHWGAHPPAPPPQEQSGPWLWEGDPSESGAAYNLTQADLSQLLDEVGGTRPPEDEPQAQMNW